MLLITTDCNCSGIIHKKTTTLRWSFKIYIVMNLNNCSLLDKMGFVHLQY